MYFSYFGSAVIVQVINFQQVNGFLQVHIKYSGVAFIANKEEYQTSLVDISNSILSSSTVLNSNFAYCVSETACTTVEKVLVTTPYVDPIPPVAQTFTMVVTVTLTTSWSAALEDPSSAEYQQLYNTVIRQMEQTGHLSSETLGFELQLRIKSFRLSSMPYTRTTSGRNRRDSDDVVADVELGGEADIGDRASLEQRLLAAINSAAAESDSLEGGAVITETMILDAGAGAIVPSLLTIIFLYLFH